MVRPSHAHFVILDGPNQYNTYKSEQYLYIHRRCTLPETNVVLGDFKSNKPIVNRHSTFNRLVPFGAMLVCLGS